MLSVSSRNLCYKSLSSQSAASTIGNNCNLLIDILYCLPVKSLCAFKTVSKQWQSLISDPYFKRNYNLRSRRLSMPALFMKRRLMNDMGWIESEFETLVMDERESIDGYVASHIPITVHCHMHINLRQSCNGLVLCELKHGFMSYGGYRPSYVIYNPSMKHYKTLPSNPSKETRVESVTVAFDPAKSNYYEVVCVCEVDTRRGMNHIEIYSSETDSWRDAGDPFFSLAGVLSVTGVYWNGSVHWIDQWRATLHYFDIECELMKRIVMPTQPYVQGDEYLWKIGYFGECRGHIHLMEMRNPDMLCFDIWEMRMDYSGWDVRYYVDLTPVTTAYPGILRDEYYLFGRFDLYVMLVEEGENSSRLILKIEKNKVISYDLKHESFNEMYDVKTDVWVEGFEYMETLAHA